MNRAARIVLVAAPFIAACSGLLAAKIIPAMFRAEQNFAADERETHAPSAAQEMKR